MKNRSLRSSLIGGLCVIFMGAAIPAWACASDELRIDTLPVEVKPFVEPGTLPIALEKADLNGDGREDFILVIEPERQEPFGSNGAKRPLLILIRAAEGTLKLAKRNDKIVLCSSCGGALGDPFQGVGAGFKSFEIFHYGGSRERWSIDFKFNYSRRDDTWQLVRVTESSFDAFDPNREKTEIYTPPGAYGKIDIADFDPDDWKGRGAR